MAASPSGRATQRRRINRKMILTYILQIQTPSATVTKQKGIQEPTPMVSVKKSKNKEPSELYTNAQHIVCIKMVEWWREGRK